MKLYVLFVISFGLFVEIASLEKKFIEDEWEAYKKTNQKSYSDAEEEAFRKENFIDSLEKVTRHNALYKEGKVKYEMRIPKSADLTTKEFIEVRTGYKSSRVEGKSMKMLVSTSNATDLPKNLDWKSQGYVTSVKNQGYCGSCWAFSICASIESQLIKRKLANQDIDLSEQQLVDCAPSDGCDGGDPYIVFNELNGDGVVGEGSYPYTANQETCKRRLTKESYNIKDVVYYRESFPNEDYMKELLANYGVLSGAMHVTENFQHYRYGIFSNDDLCPDPGVHDLNHAITITGYGVARDGTKYWIIKNSWGNLWGEAGFARIERGKGLCNIGTEFGVPIIEV